MTRSTVEAQPHRINRVNVPVIDLERPVSLLPGGAGPCVLAVPAVASGLVAESVIAELRERARRDA
jgi:hypothetical protein